MTTSDPFLLRPSGFRKWALLRRYRYAPDLPGAGSRSSVDNRAPHRLATLPVLSHDGPERLVQVPSIAQEAVAQHTLAHRAHLRERAVAAAVHRRRARLEPVDADHVERERHRQARRLDEEAAAPVRRSDREAPFGDVEVRGQLSKLNDANRHV